VLGEAASGAMGLRQTIPRRPTPPQFECRLSRCTASARRRAIPSRLKGPGLRASRPARICNLRQVSSLIVLGGVCCGVLSVVITVPG
jgi:hypothetical protein